MFKRTKVLAGLDLSSPPRIVLVSEESGKAVAYRTMKTDFHQSSEVLAALSDELRQFLKDAGERGVTAAAALPLQECLLFSISLPSLKRSELMGAIRWELERLIPGKSASMGATFAQWPDFMPPLPVGTPPAGGRQYVVAAAPNASVRAARSLMKRAGLRPVAIEVPALGASRAVSWQRPMTEIPRMIPAPETSPDFAAATRDQPAADRLQVVVSIGTEVGLYMSYGQFPWVMRKLPSESLDIESLGPLFAGEITRSLRYARTLPGEAIPGEVTLLGMSADLPALCKVLNERIQVNAHVWASPEDGLSSEYAVAFGLALRSQEVPS